MDVKGARALSERLAEAARNVDPPPAKTVGLLAAPESVDVADDAQDAFLLLDEHLIPPDAA